MGHEEEVRRILNSVPTWPCSVDENPKMACWICNTEVHMTKTILDFSGEKFVSFFISQLVLLFLLQFLEKVQLTN